MIDGHGDDAYRYGGRIRTNFSSNIYYGASHHGLKAHLADRLDVMAAYPEPYPYTLGDMIARHHGISADSVLVTSGATEAIYLIAQAFRRNGERACYAVRRPTFSEYDDACRMFGYVEAAFPDAKHTACGLYGSMDGPNTMIWLCNPNNPTGEVLPTDYIMDISRHAAITVVDQSYEDYTLMPLLSPREAIDNTRMILIHSMTKTYAVPGLRLGYITAAPDIISRLRGCMRPWSVNAFAIEAGRYLLGTGKAAIPDLKGYLADAEALRQALDCIPGINVRPTSTGFMLAEMSRGTASGLKNYLAMHHGMLIRDCSNIRGLSQRHFRVAARSREDNTALAEAVRMYMDISDD